MESHTKNTRRTRRTSKNKNKNRKNTKHTRCTLLRGPLAEVTPLLQHYPTQCIAQSDKYKLLLELYDATMVRT